MKARNWQIYNKLNVATLEEKTLIHYINTKQLTFICYHETIGCQINKTTELNSF